jgi:basic membrane protein A
MKIALIGTAKSKRDDKQWNQVGYESLMRVKHEMGVDVAYSEAVAPLNVGTVLRGYAEEGYDLVWAHGVQFEDKTLKVSREYPETCFAVSGFLRTAPNICQFSQGRHQGFYLLGMIAGSLTQKNRVGIVFGEEILPMPPAFIQAIRRGIRATNLETEIKAEAVGDWEDVKRGRKKAHSLIDWGADVIVQFGDGLSFGVYEVCEKRGVYVNGLWIDHYELAPSVMYSSLIVRFDPVLKEALIDIEKGEFMERYWLTLANGGISLAPYHKFDALIPEEVKVKVERAKQDIISGRLRLRGF